MGGMYLNNCRLCLRALLWTIGCSLLMAATSAVAEIDWNGDQLEWFGYDEGMFELNATQQAAYEEGQPIPDVKGLLIVYADWCPTCQKYGQLFDDPTVVEALDGLILMRANVDEQPEINLAFNQDGQYIPRTYALDANGNVIEQLYPQQPYRFYLRFSGPQSIINFANSLKLIPLRTP